jgi:hypothetical protein
MATFCFIASLHTKSISFRSILRRLSTYLNVFYFILNAYVLWWSNDETKIYNHVIWIILIRLHAIICFLVSGGFCLDLFTIKSCQFGIYFICSNILLDICIFYNTVQTNASYWLLVDYIIDDIAMLCGGFYLYQFNLYQKIKLKKKTE